MGRRFAGAMGPALPGSLLGSPWAVVALPGVGFVALGPAGGSSKCPQHRSGLQTHSAQGEHAAAVTISGAVNRVACNAIFPAVFFFCVNPVLSFHPGLSVWSLHHVSRLQRKKTANGAGPRHGYLILVAACMGLLARGRNQPVCEEEQMPDSNPPFKKQKGSTTWVSEQCSVLPAPEVDGT